MTSRICMWGNINHHAYGMSEKDQNSRFFWLDNLSSEMDIEGEVAQVAVVNGTQCFVLSTTGQVFTFNPRSGPHVRQMSITRVRLTGWGLTGDERIVKIAHGTNHILALDTMGNLFRAIVNHAINPVETLDKLDITPSLRHPRKPVLDICCSASMSGFVTEDGFSYLQQVHSSGSHIYTAPQIVSVPNSSIRDCIPDTDGDQPRDDRIVRAWMSDTSVFMMTDTGQLLASGMNDFGKLGQDSTGLCFRVDTSQWKSRTGSPVIIKNVALSNTCTMLISEEGDVFIAGRDYDGHYIGENVLDDKTFRLYLQLKDIDHIAVTPLSVHTQSNPHIFRKSYHCVAKSKNGELFSWGSNDYCKLGIPIPSDYSDERERLSLAQRSLSPMLVEHLYGEQVFDVDCSDHMTICAVKYTAADLGQIVNSEKYADMIFEAHDGQIIHAHKAILFARCPLLLALIASGRLQQYIKQAIDESKKKLVAHSDAQNKDVSDKEGEDSFELGGLHSVFEEIDLAGADVITVHLPSCVSYDAWLMFLAYLYTDGLLPSSRTENIEMRCNQISLLSMLGTFLHFLEYEIRDLLTDVRSHEQVVSLANTLRSQEPSLVKRIVEDMGTIFMNEAENVPKNGAISYIGSLSKMLLICDRALDTHRFPMKHNISRLSRDLDRLFNNANAYPDWQLGFKDTVDVPISNDAGEQHVIHVHRAILMCRSEFFKALTASQMEESCSEIFVIEDFPAHVMLLLARYLYNGDNSLLDEGNVVECMIAANYYEIRRLKHQCESIISKHHISYDNLWDLLQISDMHGALHLRDRCVRFVINNWDLLYDTVEYRELDSGLRAILQKQAANLRKPFRKRNQAEATSAVLSSRKLMNHGPASGATVTPGGGDSVVLPHNSSIWAYPEMQGQIQRHRSRALVKSKCVIC